MPGPMIAAYQAAKAALEAVSDSMRIEFSPFSVHVSAIASASISTPMLKRSSKQLNEDRGCLAEKPSALLCGCPPGVCEDDCHGQQIFNLPGEGISDDPPGGDGTPSPSPLPDRGGRGRRRVPEAQPSRPLDGCHHLPDDGSAATGKVAEE